MLNVLTCVLTFVFAIFLYINALNKVIELRLAIPQQKKELKEIQAENDRLHYEIDQFESPLHLMELARKPEFSHLKWPYRKNVIEVTLDEHQ